MRSLSLAQGTGLFFTQEKWRNNLKKYWGIRKKGEISWSFKKNGTFAT